MPETSNSSVAYLLGVAAVVAAAVLRFLLDPWLGDSLPYVTMFGAVAAAVWFGGAGPGVLAAACGYVACSYFFIEPRGELTLNGLPHLIGVAAYVFTCSLILWFGQAARRAHHRASERTEQLRITQQSIGDAVITTDVQARVASMNAVAETLTGWTEEQALGRPLDEVFRIVNEDTRQAVSNPAARALAEGIAVGLANHTVLIRKDGSECSIDDSAAPIRDAHGRVSGCVLIFRDVSDQRRLERDKAQQLLTARLLAAIIESTDDAIVSKSLDGHIQSWNAGAERLFGYSAEQAVGRHISLIIPPDRLKEEDDIVAKLKAGQRIEHFETERQHADGRRLIVSLTISPLKDAAGTVIGASKIARDITAQRQAEDDLRKLATDLAEADRRKNEFLAMLAHELRNPLAPISNAARILRHGDEDRHAVRMASEMLERQVGQMTRLVDDLLDMSRITRGSIELRKRHVELAPIVQQAIEAVRAQYACLDHELTVSLPPEPVHLHADPARLAQVIGNLLNNACKFMDRRGHVWLTAVEQDGEAVIRVRDTGIGIAAEQLTRVFDMFTQVDSSLERSRDGLGLGLTLVKTLVELHGGRVEARSDGLGRGSEFIVRMPVAAVAHEETVSPPLVTATPAVSRRVLVVDDSHDGAESLAMLLRFEGHQTWKAHDGLEAIEVAERMRPDVVLLDIGLPRMNGYEACRRIRQAPWGKALVLVALTGWGQEDDRIRSREAGFDAHMVKPVDHDELLEFLETLPPRTPRSHTTS